MVSSSYVFLELPMIVIMLLDVIYYMRWYRWKNYEKKN
jgi:hypothetical protein